MRIATGFVFTLLLNTVKPYYNYYENYTTTDPAGRQLLDYKHRNPIPEDFLTTSAGDKIDVRDTIAINSEFFAKESYLDATTHFDKERIPERAVHAKGVAAFGYLIVTNDVSKYTKADVFNGIGKKTRVALRFSTNRPHVGGSDFGREFKGLGAKFYTKDGNLDFTCLQTPIFIYKSPVDFFASTHSVKWNPLSNLIDHTMQWDFNTLKPDRLLSFLWVFADFGVPRNYRTSDYFPIHTYELVNKHGERYYAKFNFRTEEGVDYLTGAEAAAINSEEPDYYSRDLYNAITSKNYPVLRLDIDIMSLEQVKNLDYDPFDITVLWRNGTFKTETIGRIIINATATNHFRDSELSVFNPGSLVPGIPGPADFVFKGRKVFYRDTQNYRLGNNLHEISVNYPKYKRTYNRDGVPPVRENMWDVPNYFPNSFNGPAPYVDLERPDRKLLVLSSNAVDFGTMANFYENVLQDDAHRQRLANNIAENLETILPNVATRAVKLLTLGHPDLGRRITRALKLLKEESEKRSVRERYEDIAQCLDNNMKRFN